MKFVKFILGGQIDAKTYTDTEKNKVWLSLQIFVKKEIPHVQPKRNSMPPELIWSEEQ